MRFSVREGDDDYQHPSETRDYEVYLDGVYQRHVLVADEEEGYVVVFSHDDKGNLIAFGDEVREETRTGVVVIVPPGGAADVG